MPTDPNNHNKDRSFVQYRHRHDITFLLSAFQAGDKLSPNERIRIKAHELRTEVRRLHLSRIHIYTIESVH